MGKKGVPHRKFSKEEARRITIERLEERAGIRELLRQYQVRSGTITNWVRTYLEDSGGRSRPSSCTPTKAQSTLQGALKTPIKSISYFAPCHVTRGNSNG